MPVVSLDAKFLAHIAALESTSAAADVGTVLGGQRQWMYPPLDGWNGNPLDVASMNQAFDRSNLNNQYISVISDTTQASTIGEAMITKLQLDYIAVLERAFRTRHCSSVRAKMHAAARRRGMGTVQGPFSGSVVVWLNRLLQGAHDG